MEFDRHSLSGYSISHFLEETDNCIIAVHFAQSFPHALQQGCYLIKKKKQLKKLYREITI